MAGKEMKATGSTPPFTVEGLYDEYERAATEHLKLKDQIAPLAQQARSAREQFITLHKTLLDAGRDPFTRPETQ